MYGNTRKSDSDDGVTVVALPSRLGQLRENLDLLSKEAAQLELPLVSTLIGAASEAITEELSQR